MASSLPHLAPPTTFPPCLLAPPTNLGYQRGTASPSKGLSQGPVRGRELEQEKAERESGRGQREERSYAY